ncbi:MAG: SRPBCC domain-containing protein [Ornithinibacter sp.]
MSDGAAEPGEGQRPGPVDAVFRALADPTRRALLDSLFAADGQTLTKLTSGHDMTRVAVAKHLVILEEAGLVVSSRAGREKHHHLNAVPIRLLHDRWITKYTAAWAGDLSALRRTLEATMEKVFEIYIRTTPERLWHAITDPASRERYQFGASVHSDWTPGSTYATTHPRADRELSRGENLVVDPPRRLVQSLVTTWSDEVQAQGTTRVTWDIEQVGDSCRLTLTHDDLPDDAPPELYGGWPMILSGLKTWLETGEVLTTPGSLMYGDQ